MLKTNLFELVFNEYIFITITNRMPMNMQNQKVEMNGKYKSLLPLSLSVASKISTNFRSSLADLPPLIKREILFTNPEKLNLKISPNGKYITYLAPDKNNILQVWIRSIDRPDNQILTTNKKCSIQDYYWTYNGEQIIYYQDVSGNKNYHIHAINIKTRKVIDLTPKKNVQARIIGLNRKFPNQLLVGLNIKDRRKHDVYQIHLKTGKATLKMKNPGNFIDTIADSQFQIRAAVGITPDGGLTLSIRDNLHKPWKVIRRWGPNESANVLGFSENGKILYIAANHNSDTIRLSALNLQTRKESIVIQNLQYDLGATFIHPTKRHVQAVAFYKDKLQWQVLDKNITADFQALSKIHRGEFRVVDRDLADKMWLVAYNVDNGPIYYYKYNRVTKKSQLLFSNKPQLEDVKLAQMKPISYRSRDGLKIHGYLTVPPGIVPKKLPTVLLVHPGPWLRDTWGYNPIVQWLVNRGYAVLQVNFRGSTGYGKKFLGAGNREWGRKMHNDLIDGVNWSILQGIADPKKVAIFGSSYGGYATLAGLTFTPNVFAAGVDMFGPSNLLALMNSVSSYWEPVRAQLYRRIGHLEKEADLLKSRSPLFFVNHIQAPLLIARGGNDPRVKQIESEKFVFAMRSSNKTVEYVLYPNEGHGFTNSQNRLHFYAKAEEFLGKYLGGRIEPMGDIPGNSAITR